MTTDYTSANGSLMITAKGIRNILRGLEVRENANGLSLVDADDAEGGRWWPTQRCDDESALALAYESGAGKWHC